MHNFSDGLLDRRKFLLQVAGTSTLAAASSLVGCTSTSTSKPAKPLVGTQLYGWGQYYDRDKKNLTANLPEALSAMRDCGFDYAEGWFDAARPENMQRFADQLRERGMCALSLYTGGRLHEPGKSAAAVESLLGGARVAKAAGFSILVCNPDPIGREKTDEELRTQAAALTQLGVGLKAIGMSLAIHNHTPEMVNQAREFHYNLRQTKPGTVDFCFDVHWVYRGGLAPMDALKEYATRVVTWHLRQSRGGVWWEDLDRGDIDYLEIAQFVHRHKIPARYTIELALEQGTKITRSVVDNHRRSQEYVRRIFAC